jgi:Thaumatin family
MSGFETPRRRRRSSSFSPLAAIVIVVVLVGVTALAYASGWIGSHHEKSRPTAAALGSATASATPTGPLVMTQLPSSSPTPSASPSPHRPKPTSSATPASPPSVAGTHVASGDRRFTFVNKTAHTIWLAGWQQTPKPALTTSGWVLPAGNTLTVGVPDHWNGRFWGRTGCAFNSGGIGHCQTGDCNGKFQCKGYGGIPATLAEYNLNSFDDLDFYDVSMVDGSNLPMYINSTGGQTADKISTSGCVAAGCTKPVDCPAVLQVTVGGKVVGCISACARLNTDQYCCRGQWAPRSACDPTKWPVDYAEVFKKAEPYAYSYSDDDATSTFTCKTDCNYRITFGLTP